MMAALHLLLLLPMPPALLRSLPAHLRPAGLAVAAVLALSACQSLPPAPAALALDDSHPQHTDCPTGLPAGTHCLRGSDEAGAHWWIAVPATWDGVLVLHNHGGPELGTPSSARTREDLQRWAVMLRAGHAWAGSSYRQGGVAVHAAAEDSERLRDLFSRLVTTPRRTILHGQSWGAGVAAVQAELYPRSVDGVLLTSGVLAGGTRSYDFRLDLRVVYQALCGNHPAAGEPAYPLWQGLPPGSALTRPELARRVNACTGVSLPAAERTPAQQQRLDTLLRQARLPENTLIPHLNWATWHFQDIVFQRTGGANPFGNQGVRYDSAPQADTLNAQVARYSADPKAVALLAADTDPQGRISVPVLSLRGVHDGTAFVELDSVFRETMARAGHADTLVQTYTDEGTHSYLNDAEYPAALDALLAWVERGEKPTPQAVAARCERDTQPRFGGACRFLPDYRAAPLATRVAPRQQP